MHPAVVYVSGAPRSEQERRRLLGLGRPLLEVSCCSPAVAARRYAARAGRGDRRTDVHPITAMPPELLAEFDEPVGVGSLVRVDTSETFSVDFVAQQVQAFLRSAST